MEEKEVAVEAPFVDTSFWFALASSKDSHHSRAVELLRASQGRPLATSNFVLSETITLIRARKGHALAVAFGNQLQRDGRIRIHRITEEDEREAWRLFQRHNTQEFSFVDCTSFAVMHRLSVRQALSFDGDFSWMGFGLPGEGD